MTSGIQWIKKQTSDFYVSVPILIFLINILLVFSVFIPNLGDINTWDEAGYIRSGRLLLKGVLPDPAFSPVSALLYAIATLPYLHSPFWLIYASGLGRLVIFALLFASSYLVARQLSKFANPLIMVGLFFVSPLSIQMFRYASDPLFAALSGFAFWKMLCYYNTRQKRHLGWASAFLGLAALTRNEGSIIFVMMLLITLILTLPSKKWWQAILAAALPFIFLVGGYQLWFGAVTGNFTSNALQRSYANFEAGQELVYSTQGETLPTVEAFKEARRLFGTPEENHYLAINAILRNPGAYLQRLRSFVFSFPQVVDLAYGMRFTPILILLGLRGVFELFRRKKIKLLLMCLLWIAPLGITLLNTIARIGYLRFPFFIVFGLSAIGITAVLNNLDSRVEKLTWIIVLGGTAIFSLAKNRLGVFDGMSILLAGLLLIYLLKQIKIEPRQLQLAALLILFGAGLVLHGAYPKSTVRTLGVADAEAASVYLRDHLPQNSQVLAGAPAVIWMAGMKFANLNGTDIPTFASDQDFASWVYASGFKAVYLDESVTPYFTDLITRNVGSLFEPGYLGGSNEYRVLLVKDNPG